MAERRMFAKSIVLSDAFLDMPMSARCLYFTLGMLADDDGFINAPKSIMRQCGASDDDMRILLGKKFVISFEDGVLVIKHWRIHNYIQKDRYIPTKYEKHKSELSYDENKAYTRGQCVIEAETEEPLSPARQKRLDAMKESDLPYSFTYKIRNAFIGEVCPICGKRMGVPISDPEDPIRAISPEPTIQHNIPISLGGKHEIDNISVICASCNSSIQATPTGELNNALVRQKWDDICRVSGMYTQDSIGKDSIDKVSINTSVDDESKKPDKFEEWWQHYPRKIGKAAARKAFSKVRVDVQVLIDAVEAQKHSTQWTRDNGRYIPNPTTWLNQGRWEDEVVDTKTAKRTDIKASKEDMERMRKILERM